MHLWYEQFMMQRSGNGHGQRQVTSEACVEHWDRGPQDTAIIQEELKKGIPMDHLDGNSC